ncbi:uncharacterized protein [Lolium perenne]|uniref:uncharacterized protein n=1 Tax=Lolium perenne TaxID=4522 RepID=UPI0021F64832|nr:uncharacterized protein LOC127338333 [Lolium perenne]
MEAEANSLRLPSDWNDLITEEERAGMSYLSKSEIMKILAKAEESRRRLQLLSRNPHSFKSPVDSQSDSTVQRRRLAGDSDDKEAKRQRQGVELSGIEMQSADNLPPQPDKIFVFPEVGSGQSAIY